MDNPGIKNSDTTFHNPVLDPPAGHITSEAVTCKGTTTNGITSDKAVVNGITSHGVTTKSGTFDDSNIPDDVTTNDVSSGDAIPGAGGVSVDDSEAYVINYGAHRVGISTEECIQYYNNTEAHYEKLLNPSRYRGPIIAAIAVGKYLGHDKSIRILDVGAGTGLLGLQLVELGFTNVDALDPAHVMLDSARRKSIYNNIYCDVVGGSKVKIEDDTYECIALSGSMGEGHIPCQGLKEMIRIVKPGGLVIIVMRLEYLDYVSEYRGRLEPYMAELEQHNQWHKLERTVVPRYSFNKDGVLFVYKVTQSGCTPLLSHVLNDL